MASFQPIPVKRTITERLLESRIVIIKGEITQELVGEVTSKLLALSAESNEPINPVHPLTGRTSRFWSCYLRCHSFCGCPSQYRGKRLGGQRRGLDLCFGIQGTSILPAEYAISASPADLTVLDRQEAWEKPGGRSTGLGAPAGSDKIKNPNEY